MDCNHSASTVGMAQEMMASSASDDFKTQPAQGFDKTTAGDRRKCAHCQTATRWTPTNSLLVGSSTSRQSSIASRIRFIKTSSDFAWVWHPRRAGTDATKYPSSSLSITTLNSRIIFKSPLFSVSRIQGPSGLLRGMPAVSLSSNRPKHHVQMDARDPLLHGDFCCKGLELGTYFRSKSIETGPAW